MLGSAILKETKGGNGRSGGEEKANNRVHYNAGHGLIPSTMDCSLFQDRHLRDHMSYSISRQSVLRKRERKICPYALFS